MRYTKKPPKPSKFFKLVYIWVFKRECVKCGELVKYEKMYKSPAHLGDEGNLYYCTTCFEDKAAVSRFYHGF